MENKWIYLAKKLLTDILMINLSFLFAAFISFGIFDFRHLACVYFQQIIFINILWLIIFNLAGLYKLHKDAYSEIENILSVSFGIFSAAFFNYLIVVYLYPEASYSKEIVIIGSIFVLILVNISRFLIAKNYCK